MPKSGCFVERRFREHATPDATQSKKKRMALLWPGRCTASWLFGDKFGVHQQKFWMAVLRCLSLNFLKIADPQLNHVEACHISFADEKVPCCRTFPEFLVYQMIWPQPLDHWIILDLPQCVAIMSQSRRSASVVQGAGCWLSVVGPDGWDAWWLDRTIFDRIFCWRYFL